MDATRTQLAAALATAEAEHRTCRAWHRRDALHRTICALDAVLADLDDAAERDAEDAAEHVAIRQAQLRLTSRGEGARA